MAEVYRKEGSPYWYMDYTVPGVPRVRKSTKRKLKKEAKAVADAAEKEALDRLQINGGRPRLTLRDALAFYERKHRNNPGAYAKERIAKIVGDREDIEGLDPDMWFDEVTTTMLEAYVQRREDQGAAAQTINHETNLISAAYNIVKRDYQVREGLTFPRLERIDIPRPFTDAEVDALLAELDPAKPIKGRGGVEYVPEHGIGLVPTLLEMRQQNYDLVIGMLNSGCRLNEIAGLTWDKVAPDFTEFTFFRTKTAKKTHGAHLRFTMKASKAMREMLKRRYASRGNNRYVFPAWRRLKDGGWARDQAPMTSTKAIRNAMNKIGINTPENIAVYTRRDVRSLRDTYATRLARAGVRIEVISKLLGHASIRQTMKYASYCPDQANDEALMVLDAL